MIIFKKAQMNSAEAIAVLTFRSLSIYMCPHASIRPQTEVELREACKLEGVRRVASSTAGQKWCVA
jgi:hypothetical protein